MPGNDSDAQLVDAIKHTPEPTLTSVFGGLYALGEMNPDEQTVIVPLTFVQDDATEVYVYAAQVDAAGQIISQVDNVEMYRLRNGDVLDENVKTSSFFSDENIRNAQDALYKNVAQSLSHFQKLNIVMDLGYELDLPSEDLPDVNADNIDGYIELLREAAQSVELVISNSYTGPELAAEGHDFVDGVRSSFGAHAILSNVDNIRADLKEAVSDFDPLTADRQAQIYAGINGDLEQVKTVAGLENSMVP